jgi:hypothetical protein
MGRHQFWAAFVLIVLCSAAASAQPVSIIHDPWLNWDFVNRTGTTANDLDIIVETPDYTPPEVFMGGYLVFESCPDPAGTRLVWCGYDVPPGGVSHVGAYMLGSGRILDAYWTDCGEKIGASLPITYELTEIFDPDPVIPDNSEIHMLLQFAPGYYADPLNAGTIIGWANIQTFANIPAEMLGLPDLNDSLDLGMLEPYKCDAREGGPGGEIISDTVWWEEFPPESFFDVYFDVDVPDADLGPHRESLLVADIVVFDGVETVMVGQFWNLNPQCPEPGTFALVGLGIAALVIRLRRKR